MDFQRIVQRWNRFAEPRRLLLDSLLAAAIALLSVVPEFWERLGTPVVWRIVLGTVVCVAVAFRRTRPDISGLVIAGASAAHLVVDDRLSPAVTVTAVIGLYSMAAYGSTRGTQAALVLGVFGSAAASGRLYSAAEDSPSYEITLPNAVALGSLGAGIWATGMLRRTRIREVQVLRERARLLELERAQEAEIAAIGERTRIAREMHDIIAHTLTVVIAQADGGRYAARQDPALAVKALATIADNGRQALADMRSLLGVLRDDGPREIRAVPGIADIPELIESVRAGGLPVRLDSFGPGREVPVGCGLTAYRIVQESLTNILKHAGLGASAHVELHWKSDELAIIVADDGQGAALAPGAGEPRSTGGKGLLGMRERAELHGGSVQAGFRDDGPGYRVHASLPTGEVR
jgi:signal transduction histidine kinase